MDNLKVFLKWFLFGWSVAAVLVFVATWFYMPNIFADKVIEINTRWRKAKEEKEMIKAQKQLARIQKQITLYRVHNANIAKIRMLEKHGSRMSYSDFLKASNNFSDENVIGIGKCATLYKAAIGYGNFLTVKRFRDFPNVEQKFMREIMTNGRLKHRNLVSLLGFCTEDEEKLLVYNYMANGSLYDWLHPMDVGHKRPTLNWPLRYIITVGIARGLAWLHHNCYSRVTHGNLCSKFIFLDYKFDPKISPFGGRMTVGSNSGNLRMTICEKSEFIESDDVYAFGVLLIEVVTGKKPEDVFNLFEGFDGTLISGNLCNAIDSSLSGKGFDSDISQFLGVALDCMGLSLNEKPTMLEVHKSLISIGAKNGNVYTSEITVQIGDGGGTHMAEQCGIDIIEEDE